MPKPTKLVRNLALFVAGVIVGAALAYITAGPDPDVLDEQRYCAMVQAGHWPDFNDNADRVCKGAAPTK